MVVEIVPLLKMQVDAVDVGLGRVNLVVVLESTLADTADEF
jgi:hypothetical protein